VCRNPVESIGEMVGNAVGAKHNGRRKGIPVAHRLRILLDDLMGGPGDALLDGGINLNCSQRNAAQFGRWLDLVISFME
jgi:hypothetical protein